MNSFTYYQQLSTVIKAYKYTKTNELPEEILSSIDNYVKEQKDIDTFSISSIYITEQINLRILSQIIMKFDIISLFEISSIWKNIISY